MLGFGAFAQGQRCGVAGLALLTDGNTLNACCLGSTRCLGCAADGNRARLTCHGILPCGKAVLSCGIRGYAQGNRCHAFGFGAVAYGNGVAAAGASALANGNVVGGVNGSRACTCAVGVCAHGDIVVGLNALCCAGANADDVVDIFCGAARIAYRAFANTDIAEIAGVSRACTRLLTDKHIGTTSGVGVPTQGGGIQTCGFGTIAQSGRSVGGTAVCTNGNRTVISGIGFVACRNGIFASSIGLRTNSNRIGFFGDASIAHR